MSNLPDELSLRKATELDRESIRHLYSLTDLWRNPDDEHSPTFDVDDVRYVDNWSPQFDGAVVLVEKDSGDIAGGVWLRHFSAADPGWGFVDEIYPEVTTTVLPKWAGNGLGTVLLEEAIKIGQADGAKGLSLWVEENNERAQRACEKAGFEKVRETDNGGIIMLHKLD